MNRLPVVTFSPFTRKLSFEQAFCRELVKAILPRFFVVSLSVFAPFQGISQWIWQNPLPQGNDLSAVAATSMNEIWVSGSRGVILRSTNLGASWELSTLPERINGVSLVFATSEAGWVCGETPTSSPSFIFGTTDGGQTWVEQLRDSIEDISTINFFDELKGWAAGDLGTIWYTSDGGMEWNPQISFPGEFIRNFNIFDSLTVLASGSIGARTTDGGENWTIDSNIPSSVDMHFVDQWTGWACGTSRIQMTNDGGITWDTQLDTSGIIWNTVFMLNHDLGWAVSGTSGEGLIARTTNGGGSWLYVSNPTEEPLNGIRFMDQAVGMTIGDNGTLMLSTDSGISWTSQKTSATDRELRGIHFADEDNGWIAGDNGIVLRTTTRGENWSEFSTGATSSLNGVWFVDWARGWAVGSDGTIVRTSDSGDTWEPQSSPVFSHWGDIHFGQYPVGWIVGGDLFSDGKLLKTSDGGNTWVEISSAVLGGSAKKIEFSSATTGWILAGNPTLGSVQAVYKTTDGGVTWPVVLSGNSDTTFASMSFVDDATGWVSATSRVLFKTMDAGVTWETKSTPKIFKELFFLDHLTGWAGTVDGEVFQTTDGGDIWSSQGSTLQWPVADIFFTNLNTGWVSSAYGSILHTNNGGSTDVPLVEPKEEMRTGFELLLNYPNPFNSGTRISVRIDEQTTKVILDIYDILGRRIRSLGPIRLSAGFHSIYWDGMNSTGTRAPSGVYLCKAIIDGHGQYRKMMLLR